jgi:hypothetical protein
LTSPGTLTSTLRPASESSGAGRTFAAREVETWPKRADAEAALGVSKSTVRRLEKSEVLVGVRDEDGVTRIEPESLARAVRQLGASSAATDAPLRRSAFTHGDKVGMPPVTVPERRVAGAMREPEIFAALSAGRSPVQIVIELEVTAAEVEAAIVSWQRLMLPWEPPASAVVAHVDALTACVHELHALVCTLDARLVRLEQYVGCRGASTSHPGIEH